MNSKKKRSSYDKNQSDQFNSSYFLLNQSLPSFGKNDNYFSQFSHCYPNQQSKYDSSNNTISSTGQFGVTKNSYLCCRTFFTEDQTIPHPESMTYEFKCYNFPFTKSKNDTLKKTICAFLNAKGGHIFLGIEENVDTKQHRVRGRVYNEAQKEQILKIMRTNAESIQPDIIVNNKMEIRFVPVKNSQYPYQYLLGRYVIRIKIYPGIRDEVYTVKQDEGDYIVCMRTQNQVLTYDFRKQPRKLLSIQKQRAQNPYNQLQMMNRHECKRPEEGARLFSLQKVKCNQKYETDDSDLQKKEKNILTRDRKRYQYTSQLSPGKEQKEKQLSKTQNQTKKEFNQKSSHSDSNNSNIFCRKKNQTKRQRKQRKRKQKQRQNKQGCKQIEKKNKNFEPLQKSPQYATKERKQEIKIGCFRVIQRYQKITDAPEFLNKSMDASYQKSKNINSKKSKKQESKQSSLKSHEKSKQTQVSHGHFFLKSSDQIESKSIQKNIKDCSQEPKNRRYRSNSYQKKQKKSILNTSTINDSMIKGMGRKQNNKKNNFQQKLYHLQKYHKPVDRSFLWRNLNFNSENKKNYQSQKISLKQSVCQLLSINYSNHRYFVFEGFSPRRISIILEEFINIGEYNYIQLGNLFLYRFNKATNQNIIKQTITRAIHIRKKPKDKHNMSLGNIGDNESMVYPNTKKKKDKLNNSLHFNQDKEQASQYDSQRIGSSFLSIKGANIENNTRNGVKKHLKRIFKVSVRIKIPKYNKLPAEVKQKLRQTIFLIESLCLKKGLTQTVFNSADEKQLNVRQQRLRYNQQQQEQEKESVKEIQFINLYYSLLTYLEMRNYNIDMIFC